MVSEMPPKLPQAPPMFAGTPTSIVEDAERLIDSSYKAQNEVVKNVQPDTATFSNVLLPLAHVENAIALEAHILGFYKIVSPDSKLRAASSEAQKLLDNFNIETAMREDLYGLVDAVLRKKEDLDPESYRLLVKKHKDYIKNGLNLPAGPQRDRFKEIKLSLGQLTRQFRQNIIEENGGIWFLPQDLDGISKEVLSRLESGESEGENSGKLRLTFKDPDFYATMRFAKKDETRKRMYIAYDNMCNQNVPIFREVMVLRDEAARLLGYPNHATFRLEDKMAKTPETVNTFLGDLRFRLTTGATRELEKLKQLKESDLNSRGEVFDGCFLSWDLSFYHRLMLETQYLVYQAKIADFFPLQTTVLRMLGIFQRLFGLLFLEIPNDQRDKIAISGKGSDLVWHEEVQIFSVWNEDGSGFVGYIYFDLFPREGKHGHASNFNLWPGFLHKNGTRQYPATALVCNFSKPTSMKPSLLTHREVITLFHELGHAIHDLVSKTIYSRFHGTNTVIDFGEAPSQMLEHWCWEPSALKSLSSHYIRQEQKIPDEMIKSMIGAKRVNSALLTLKQLHLGIFDMIVHEPNCHGTIEKLNISATYNTLQKDLMQIDGPEALGLGEEWGHGQARFGHLMGDYDVGYYGYLSSQVYSADMFYTVFKENPMSPEEGRRYRYMVLEKGGGQDEMKTLIDFLGREPKTEAFYREIGLA